MNSEKILYGYETKTSRLKTQTDPNGTVKTFTYGIDNLLTDIVYAEGSGVAATPAVKLAYGDDFARLNTASSSVGVISVGYGAYATHPYGTPTNSRGRVTTVDGVWADDTISYGTDNLGRVEQRQINGAANQTDWAFDAMGRVSEIVNNLGTFVPSYLNAAYGDTRPDQMTNPHSMTTKCQSNTSR